MAHEGGSNGDGELRQRRPWATEDEVIKFMCDPLPNCDLANYHDDKQHWLMRWQYSVNVVLEENAVQGNGGRKQMNINEMVSIICG